MDSRQLHQCLLEDSKTRPWVGGVLAMDELDINNPQPYNKKLFIINTQPASEPGSHWLALYLPSNSQPLEFFDALGRSPSTDDPLLMAFKNINKKDFICNTTPLQSETAHTCGQFCVYYLTHRVRGVTMDNIVKDFSLIPIM